MGTCSVKNNTQARPVEEIKEFPYLVSFEAFYLADKEILYSNDKSSVYRAINIKTKHPVLVKQVTNIAFGPKFLQEANIMRRLDHPNILKLVNYFRTKEFHYMIFSDDGRSTNILSYFQSKTKAFEMKHYRRLFIDVLYTIKFLHDNKIAHLSLDFDTIYYNDKGQVSIMWFSNAVDFSKIKDEKHSELIENPSDMAPCFRPPEAFRGMQGYKSDVWILGVVFYGIVAAKLPYEGHEKKEIEAKIATQELDTKLLEKRGAVPNLIELIQKMLTKDYSKRPTVDELLHFKFFEEIKSNSKESIDLISNTLNAFGQKNKVLQKLRYTLSDIALTKAERNEFLAYFNKIDKNKDGKITFEELLAVKPLFRLQLEDSQLKKLFDDIDQNKSGAIDFTEFIAALINVQRDNSRNQIKILFSEIDGNKDGLLTLEEMESYLGHDPVLLEDLKKLNIGLTASKGLNLAEFEELIYSLDF